MVRSRRIVPAKALKDEQEIMKPSQVWVNTENAMGGGVDLEPDVSNNVIDTGLMY